MGREGMSDVSEFGSGGYQSLCSHTAIQIPKFSDTCDHVCRIVPIPVYSPIYTSW